MKSIALRSARRRPLKNLHAEAALFRGRALAGFLIIAAALLILSGWYFRLQVIHNADYRDPNDRAEKDRLGRGTRPIWTYLTRSIQMAVRPQDNRWERRRRWKEIVDFL